VELLVTQVNTLVLALGLQVFQHHLQQLLQLLQIE
jgi:hypothetical protein